MIRNVLRSELKYTLPEVYKTILVSRIQKVLRADPYTRNENGYSIRSLYFDDVDSSAYFDKTSGIAKREKFRIRFYNFDPSFILLEKKNKIGEKILKTSVRLQEKELDAIFGGRASLLLDSENALLSEFGAKICSAGLRPRIFVDYKRLAFYHPVENTRITFDSAVAALPFRGELFQKNLVSVPALEWNETILEIKYNNVFIPYLRDLISDIPLIRQANSKFCRCIDALGEVIE